ncbi:MAG: DUF4115 domain-containing protein [Gammaproteobacteria bacterium]|nr:DUF4115 domain-containing protein [Gammaproteobacteria bacterium]
MLRQAREAAGISRDDLARRTRLELKIVDAIESEDFGSLAAATFVRGYIRSLAKELKLDPTPILAQYTQLAALDDPGLMDFTTRSPAQITSSSTLMRGISILLAIIVIVLIALWGHRNYQGDGDTVDALAQLAEESGLEVPADPGTPLPYSYTIVDHSAEPSRPVNSWRRQTDGSAPPQVDSHLPDEPRPLENNQIAAEVASPNAKFESIVSNTENASDAGPAASGELILIGDGESWIEISDFAGKRLYFGLLKPDQQVGLSGQPPYDLVIGNAAVVKIVYLGRPVDVRAHAVNGVARFSLGEPH